MNSSVGFLPVAKDALGTRRVPVIELLRGLAAISVVLFHLSNSMESETPRVLTAYGWLGVDVFFVISGFVIPYSLHGTGYSIRNFPRFMLRRVVRLEPPYLASILFAVMLWDLSLMVPGISGRAAERFALADRLSFFFTPSRCRATVGSIPSIGHSLTNSSSISSSASLSVCSSRGGRMDGPARLGDRSA
jgi:hypothetical protein